MITNGTVIAIASLYFIQALVISLQNYFGPRTLLFGVSVPEAEIKDAAVRRIRMQYTMMMGILVLLMAAVCFSLIQYNGAAHALLYFLIALFLQFPLSGIAIAVCRRSALRLKAARGWQAPVEPRRSALLSGIRQHPPMLGLPWYGAHFAVTVICAVIAIVKWEDIPASFALQWGIDRLPDWMSWYSAKSVGSVFYENFGQLIGIGIFILLNLTAGKVRTSLDPQDPNGSLQKQLRYKRINSMILWATSLAMVIFLGVFQAGRIYSAFELDVLRMALFALLLTVYLVMLGMLIYLRARSLDQQRDIPSQGEQHWRIMSAFYYNPEDPAIFIPKPYGIGWTVNMAKPMSWLTIAAIVGVPAMLLAWVWLLVK